MSLGVFAGQTWGFLALCSAGFGAAASACVVVIRKARLARRLTALEAENETLRDRVFHLAEQEGLYRSLIEDHGDIIVRRDAENRIVYANPAFLDLVAELKERPASLIGSRFDLQGETSRVRPPREGLPLGYEQRVETSGGTRWIAFVEAPIRDSETGRIHHQMVGRDVTERRLAEAASEAKSRFLATVSHEIRTPLNGVLGMAQLLRQTRINPEQTTYVDAIRTSGEALLSLIEQILDFSRIEAGKLELVSEPFDLQALVESVVELLAPKAQDKGLEIALSIAPNVPRAVIGDGSRLRQVLTNLAGNAVKFTESGGVGISLALEADGFVVFRVEDTGIGIPANQLQAIFEEFEQADGSNARKFEGTGLGLAISRKIVSSLGGSIEVESLVGRGSKFSVRLMLEADRAKHDSLQRHIPDFSNLQALIVAKGPFEADFMAERLRETGAEVTVVDSLHAATAFLSKYRRKGVGQRCDLMIADAALGDDSKKLANLAEAAGIRTRIVLLSPFERHEFGSPVESGFNGYLTKPVRTRSLFARLANEPVETGRDGSAQVSEARKAAGNPAAKWRPETAQKLAGMRILLAEDNEINALLTERLLSRAGAETVLMRDGRTALQSFEDSLQGRIPPFDLVLLDMRMPCLDGLETVQRMREAERRSGMARHRILALTANAFTEDRDACLGAGFDVFLTKPLNLETLVETVSRPPSDRALGAA
ncbi:MAG: response regulator [Beijerinckiaceae bacterium]|nr:response regulator [Beijerinckiaceae bacterium]